MDIHHWFLLGGIFLLVMVLGEQWLKHGPISSAIVYLLLGLLLGPKFFNLLKFDILEHPHVMEIGAEIVVLISLFSAGLKLQMPFSHLHWKISAILASGTMLVTVALLGATGHFLLGLPWGAALLLAGILAPTDPVLASEVQVQDENDKDRIRRSLTGEAGLNDGTAFPVVMLALVVLGLRWGDGQNTWQDPLMKWVVIDFAWGISGGLLIGYFFGWLAAKLIISFHAERSETLVIEDFVSIGLIGATYGFAQMVSTYGFLAVFAAGVAFARIEGRFYSNQAGASGGEPGDAFSPALIRFSTQLERIGEIAMVVFVGFIAGSLDYSWGAMLLPMLLVLMIRPTAVFLTLGRRLSLKENTIIAWFGVRGIGSIYYLSYALNRGLKGESAAKIFNLVMLTIVISIVAHGVSASPFMRRYARAKAASP